MMECEMTGKAEDAKRGMGTDRGSASRVLRKRSLLFCVLFFCICLTPVFLSFLPGAGKGAASEAKEAFPKLVGKDGWNVTFLQDAGTYFEKNFGYRDQALTANSWIYANLLGTSAVDGVIAGTEGWLYYKDSLDDYIGRNCLSDRSLFNIAHTEAMVQRDLGLLGIQTVFAIAPNKNTLYGEHMPYYDSLRVAPGKNLHRLEAYLQQENVNHVDLEQVFKGWEEVLYHRLDSHWTNKGAAIAANAILEAAGKGGPFFAEDNFAPGEAFSGDLERMMYPAYGKTETQTIYGEPFHYAYLGEVESNFDPMIETVNPSASGGIVMFRDSFGNAILPYIAEAYGSAYFSRGVPWQINEVYQRGADTVVMLRAERFLPEIAQNPPAMEALPLFQAPPVGTEAENGAVLTEVVQEDYLKKISGTISPAYLGEKDRIYVRINGELMYEAFPRSVETAGIICDNGFTIYLSDLALTQEHNLLEIFAGDETEITKVYQTEV